MNAVGSSPAKLSPSKCNSIGCSNRYAMFHAVPAVPCGDGPYVRAKHAQLVEKDLEAAILWFWKAINEGDRVESALKDMAEVMKQLNRAEEAIEAIKSCRGLCMKHAQESLNNVLMELYKKCGRVDDQIRLLKHKLRMIYHGQAFSGKNSRSHGGNLQVSIQQESSRTLGNLAWAYMQKSNFISAEVVYRKAQMIDPDANKACNLCQCLIKQARYDEARLILEDVLQGKHPGSSSLRTRAQAEELLAELEAKQPAILQPGLEEPDEHDFAAELDGLMNVWPPPRARRLPIFEEITPLRDQRAC